MERNVIFREGCIGQYTIPTFREGLRVRDRDTVQRMFYGKMKELRIWKGIRTEEQIQNTMLLGAGPKWIENGLIMYYSLDKENVKRNISDLCRNGGLGGQSHKSHWVSNDFVLDAHALDVIYE